MTISELCNKKVCVISLGCDKNTVDSERILFKLKEFGFGITGVPKEANIIIVNTCAFIEEARRESIDKILEMQEFKKQFAEKLIVVGCLPAKNLEEIKNAMPEVDCFLGIESYNDIVQAIVKCYDLDIKAKDIDTKIPKLDRIVSTPKHYAYLKIAEGCSNKCSYCTIPQIRGPYRSVPIENLLSEARLLVDYGVKELILVAQDVTRYGEDIYKKHMLADLIRQLSTIKGLEWIRLHYCYPEFVSESLINEIANNPKVCKYMDIPIQHISDKLLKAMNRASTRHRVTALIEKLRECCPDIAIRTSIIVGFPGETQKDFKELKEFLINQKLDNVGFFRYSRENGTPAYNLSKQVYKHIKNSRLKQLVELQSAIMYQKLLSQIGKIQRAICDGVDGENYIFRTQYNSPDIDSVVYVSSKTLKNIQVGNFYNIKILSIVEPFDLRGEII